jgi:mono/diheme cytochrome c family protein
MHRTWAFVSTFVLVLSLTALPVSAAPPSGGDAHRGSHIFDLAGGCWCHTTDAGLLAGGERFDGSFGTVFSANITPNSATGIGDWTDQQVMTAIHDGKDNQGNQLSPIMPYIYFSGIADQDLSDLVAFVRCLPPINNNVPDNKLTAPIPPFTPSRVPPPTAPTTGLGRAAYLVGRISGCAYCHTPKGPDGLPEVSGFLGGGLIPGDGWAPNITPDEKTGIGSWTLDQIIQSVRDGVTPAGARIAGPMANAIDRGFQYMSDSDAQVIADYLKRIPPVTSGAPQVTPGP